MIIMKSPFLHEDDCQERTVLRDDGQAEDEVVKMTVMKNTTFMRMAIIIKTLPLSR